jgi:hypothetical protein
VQELTKPLTAVTKKSFLPKRSMGFTRKFESSQSQPNMEATMPAQSSMHFYLNWAKERIDEMDAALASLEATAGQVQASSRVKADQLMADMRKNRNDFQDIFKNQAEADEAAWVGIKAELETKWDDFEADIKTYIDNFGKQVEQQQAVFKDIAAAQLKAWREAADKFPGAAAEFAADTRADIDAAVEQMKANASEAEVRLQQLKQAGTETWVALSAALKESRAVFDRANQAAWDAFKRTAAPR